MISRTPSPTKSPRRLALSSKDGNVKLSPKKSLKSTTTPNLSPSRPRSSLSRSPSTSKQLLAKAKPSLGFTIYQDPKDYSTEMYLSSVKLQSDENDYTGNKENIEPKYSNSRCSSPSKKRARSSLSDRNILENPGYIQYTSLPRVSNLYQLDTVWNNSNNVEIPSYVTPPRKDRVKYLSFVNPREKPIKRSSSLNDFNSERVVKKLVFDIHKD